MSGATFLRTCRRDAELASIPAVVLSGYDLAIKDLTDLPGVAFLAKPVNAEDLFEVITRATREPGRPEIQAHGQEG
jgi:CheY-like chemotaxis protein